MFYLIFVFWTFVFLPLCHFLTRTEWLCKKTIKNYWIFFIVTRLLLFQLLIVSLSVSIFFVQYKTKQKQKKVYGFHNIFWRIFKILIIHKPFLEKREVTHKIWARSVQLFWRLLDTNKQTPRHTPRHTNYVYWRHSKVW